MPPPSPLLSALSERLKPSDPLSSPQGKNGAPSLKAVPTLAAAGLGPGIAAEASCLKAPISSVCEGVRSRRLELTGEKERGPLPPPPRSGLFIQGGKAEAEAGASGVGRGSPVPSAPESAPSSVDAAAGSWASEEGLCEPDGFWSWEAEEGMASGRTTMGRTVGDESNDGARST